MTSDVPQSEHLQSKDAGKLPRVPRWLVSIVVALLLTYSAYSFFYPSFTWSQTTTVTVSTPNGLRSGSSTVRVSWWAKPRILYDERSTSYEVTGEATVVDLGGGRYLFALISGAESRGLQVFGAAKRPLRLTKGTLVDAASTVVANSGKTVSLSPEFYPLLVTFDDIDDPASVRRVNPGELSARFGPGYHLSDITLSITDEPVSEGRVEQVLRWIIDVGNERFYLHQNTPRLLKDFSAEQRIKPSHFLSIDHWRK